MLEWYSRIVTALVLALAAVAGAGILVMVALTCTDVFLRLPFINLSLRGAVELVEMAGAITISCALPYTTAVKGHVTVEFFFQRLSRRWRTAVDTVSRSLGMALFGTMAWRFVKYGGALHSSGRVTPTLEIPIFWLPHVLAASCALVVLVILHNMLHPGREMIRP